MALSDITVLKRFNQKQQAAEVYYLNLRQKGFGCEVEDDGNRHPKAYEEFPLTNVVRGIRPSLCLPFCLLRRLRQVRIGRRIL